MKLSLKTLAATVALVLASSAAFAVVPTVPVQPAAGPTPLANTGDGGLIVSVFDQVRGVSLVQYLGLTYSQMLNGGTNATPEAGLTLNFGTLQGYNAVFGASNVGDIQYTVSAADNTASSGSFFGKNLETTLLSVGTIRNNTVSTATNNANNFAASALNGPSGCNGVNPCTAASSADASYAAPASGNWGATYGAGLSAAGTVDNALNFYSVSAANSSSGVTSAIVTQYANSVGVAKWLLTSSGGLTYTLAGTSVPLPAAVWLLVSGLMGLGTVSRRRAAASLAA